MKSPWYCPYCDLTSERKWNVSTHIQRKHPREFNPFDILKNKNIVFTDSKYEPQIPERFNSTSNSSAEFDWSDPVQIVDKSTNMQNLIEEIKKLSKLEQAALLLAIYKLQQS